jgi:hypothetical protein
MKTLLQVRASELLPWRNLAALLAASAGAGAVGFAVKSLISAHTLALLLATAVAHSITYALLVWNFDLLSAHERLVISEWVRRTFGNFARVLEYRKG